jgi:SAM-dependent methyltransferase
VHAPAEPPLGEPHPSGAARAIAREFDGKAHGYEEGRLGSWYRAQDEIVLEHLPPLRGSILDIGCGTGWLLRRALERNPEAFGVGVDLSPEMVREARERSERDGIARIIFIEGDWEDAGARSRVLRALPSKPEVVTCVSAFHYFRDPRSAAAHVLGALAPEGRFLLLDRAKDASVGTLAWDLVHRHLVRDHASFYRTDELEEILDRAGFEETRLVTRVNRLFWKGKIHSSLAFLSANAPRERLST